MSRLSQIAISAFAVVCLSACGDKKTGGDKVQSEDFRGAIEELTEQEGIGTFTEALKEVSTTAEGPFTIFAVADEAFDYYTKAEMKAAAKHHVIKGTYAPEDLKAASSLVAIDGTRLEVDVFTEPAGKGGDGSGDESLIYLNGAIISDVYIVIGSDVVYLVDGIIPPSIVPPSRDKTDEYTKWVAKKIVGKWRITSARREHFVDGEYTHTENVFDHYSCRESYDWDRTQKNKRVHGGFTLSHNNCNSIGGSSTYARKDGAEWAFELSPDKSRLGSIVFYAPNMAPGVVTSRYPLNKSVGVGGNMEFVLEYSGSPRFTDYIRLHRVSNIP